MKYIVEVTKYTTSLEESKEYEKVYRTERAALLHCIENFKFMGGKWQKWVGDDQYVAQVLPRFEV